MSYNSIDSSVSDAIVVELYEFKQHTNVWRFTSCDEPIVKDSFTYLPISISRDRVKQNSDAFKNDLRLSFNRKNAFAAQFLNYTPDSVTTVTVFRGHIGSNEWIAYWRGRVQSGEASENTITINCESIFTSVMRPGLRARYEYNCRHPLYSTSCRVSAAAFRVNGTIAIVSTDNASIGVPACIPYASGHFSGGFVEINGQRRFIIAHAADVLTLSRPLKEAVAGASIAVYPGCDHALSTCSSKFNNIDNFGGFPWIPTANPFGGSSIV